MFKNNNFLLIYLKLLKIINGDWGLGIGIGDWGLGPIPNPQSPIPNPQSPIFYNISFISISKVIIKIKLIKIIKISKLKYLCLKRKKAMYKRKVL